MPAISLSLISSLVLTGLALWPIGAHSDGPATSQATPLSASQADCAQALAQAIKRIRLSSPPTHTGKSAASNAPASASPCEKHPWIQRIRHWADRGMELHTAMSLAVQPIPVIDSRELPEGLIDIAWLVAAYTLAEAGYFREAESLWIRLTRHREQWPEPWLNLALLQARRGKWRQAEELTLQAMRRCDPSTCQADYQSTLDWLRSGGEARHELER